MHTIGIAVIAALAAAGKAQQDSTKVEWAQCCVGGKFPATPTNLAYCNKFTITAPLGAGFFNGGKGPCTTFVNEHMGQECIYMVGCNSGATSWLTRQFNGEDKPHHELRTLCLRNNHQDVLTLYEDPQGYIWLPVLLQRGVWADSLNSRSLTECDVPASTCLDAQCK